MKKRIMAVALAGVMALSLAACGGSAAKTEGTTAAGTTAAAQEEQKTEAAEKTVDGEAMKINVIAKGFQHQFWKAVEKGAMQAGKDLNAEVSFQGPDNESAIAQQVEYLDAAIAQKPTAICLAALDTKACIGSIQNAMDKNIPIIGFDSGVPDAPEGAIKANASTNNYEAGKLAAKETYALIKDKIEGATDVVRIGVVAQESNSQSIVERTKGFVESMTELIGADKVSVEGHDSLKNEKSGAKVIIDVGIPAEVKDADAAAVASAILEKSDLIAIYGSNEFAANAIITANEGLDKIGEGKVVAVGFDAGSKQLQAIRDGLFAGSVTQDPVQIGYKAVELAVKAAKGESVSDVDTGAKWYNAENMDADDIKPCLYE
ncbi:MAG: ABC transporter substrate-binding protein [Oribacterium parvum]|uniref:ABC transporter substrate-binding protein n=1 Tax=Oribacterium parvum TaxID=1501329 RepID=UPI001CADC0D5|nr:ABC transporter substrate-binding protein [Oribacterium parvum]MBF1268846.1 ABC transporter substrate-binding protein [Oribacterium parvum]